MFERVERWLQGAFKPSVYRLGVAISFSGVTTAQKSTGKDLIERRAEAKRRESYLPFLSITKGPDSSTVANPRISVAKLAHVEAWSLQALNTSSIEKFFLLIDSHEEHSST